ncbi:unnamed protein product [Paramecium sonneborni]|uniref:Uncharacterized protein n=1 Tax=Paramecium sonneborni TaxID=65129 RepID=A0A8S1NAD6_9CILI|nr:unnamed protein product [Paramecium sonneborni]
MINQKYKITNAFEQNENFQNQNLVMKTLKNNYFQIVLNSKLEELKLEELITITQEKFSLYCKYISRCLQMQKIELPSAFKLDIKNDLVTLQQMELPIIASPFQRLILNPQFINQKYFFENLANGSESFLNYFDSIFFEELLLTLLFWYILQNLRQINETDSYDIYIYPQRCNFYIIKNNVAPFFKSEKLMMLNILLNSQTLPQINNDLEINQEYQIQLFDIHPPDKIVNKGIIIPIKNIIQQKQSSMESDLEIQKYFKFDQVTITSKPYYFIFSTLCEIEKKDDLNHIIEFSTSGSPKCQICNYSIHPDNFDTFYTKKDLLDIWQKGQLWFKQQARLVSPIFLLGKQKFQIKEDENQENLLIQFYFQNKKQDLILKDQQQQDLDQSEDTKEKLECLLLYKRLKVVQPFLNQKFDQVDSMQQYEITESLESDDEDESNNIQQKENLIKQTKIK